MDGSAEFDACVIIDSVVDAGDGSACAVDTSGVAVCEVSDCRLEERLSVVLDCW